MDWFYVILAGLFEAFGVVMINAYTQKKKWHYLAALIIGFIFSFVLLSLAMKTLSMGTAYAVWTGIGAVGGTVFGMLLYNESKDWKRIVCILLIISAAVGLKLTA